MYIQNSSIDVEVSHINRIEFDAHYIHTGYFFTGADGRGSQGSRKLVDSDSLDFSARQDEQKRI